jgi:benzoate membrane transport protein
LLGGVRRWIGRAPVSFLVTIADLGLLNIGAAFWGLAAGVAVSWCLERRDFAASSLLSSTGQTRPG